MQSRLLQSLVDCHAAVENAQYVLNYGGDDP